jgi:hypothetical protein
MTDDHDDKSSEPPPAQLSGCATRTAIMKARDIFGIVVRAFGLVLMLYGLWFLAFAIAQACGMPQEYPGEMAGYFVSGIPSFALGLIFLRCARQIVRFSYPGERDDSDHAA